MTQMDGIEIMVQDGEHLVVMNIGSFHRVEEHKAELWMTLADAKRVHRLLGSAIEKCEAETANPNA